MKKTIGDRVKRLEESIPQNKPRTQQKEDLSDWIDLLEDWPEQYFCKNIYKTAAQIAAEIDSLRVECRKLAERVRTGEFADLQAILDQLPMNALLGMRDYLQREEDDVRA